MSQYYNRLADTYLRNYEIWLNFSIYLQSTFTSALAWWKLICACFVIWYVDCIAKLMSLY